MKTQEQRLIELEKKVKDNLYDWQLLKFELKMLEINVKRLKDKLNEK